MMGPDYWFKENISIVDIELPSGISINSIDDDRRLEISNPSDIPLYLLGSPTPTHFIGLDDFFIREFPRPDTGLQLPEDLHPLIMVSSDEVFEWIPIEVIGEEQYQWEWTRVMSPFSSQAAVIWPGAGRIFSVNGTLSTFPNGNIAEFTRPERVTLPPARPSKFFLGYEGTIIEISVTISYELNHEYIPQPDQIESTRFDLEAELFSIGALLLVGSPFILALIGFFFLIPCIYSFIRTSRDGT